MVSKDLSQIRLAQPTYPLLGLLVQLLTLGIFSVEGGAKAWFELVLVTAALCASGYIFWWQVPLLIAAVFLSTLAAGMFSVLAPQYLETGSFEANEEIASVLRTISKNNLSEISTLSGDKLEQRLKQLYKAQQIFESNPRIVEQISELQSALDNINQARHIATEKVGVQRETYAHQQRQIQKLEKQRKEDEEERKREQNELKTREWEANQEKLRLDAELKAQQEGLRKAAKEKEEQEASKKKEAWMIWLHQQRRREEFTGGCPPDDRYEPPRCRPGYPIKVTLDKKPDGFDGIIWKPSDTKYDSIRPRWCYTSVQEAEGERGRYKFRRPLNNQGSPRP